MEPPTQVRRLHTTMIRSLISSVEGPRSPPWGGTRMGGFTELSMFKWENACQTDIERLEIIACLLKKHPKLLHVLFDRNCPRLRLSLEEIKDMTGVLSSGEKVLIKMAMDIWDGHGGALFKEIYTVLDSVNFENTMDALKLLKNSSIL